MSKEIDITGKKFTGLDSYEYCIQELEKENEQLKEILFLSVWNKKD